MRKAISTAVLVWAGFLILVELDIRWCRRQARALGINGSSEDSRKDARGGP
jgi:hypothetical protein